MSLLNDGNGSTRLTLEQILEALSLLAQTGSDSDRIRALSLLAKQQGSGPAAVTLPEPMDDAEVVERLGRLNAGAGPLLARLGLEAAFPQPGRGVSALTAEDLPREAQERIAQVHDLKTLFEFYPTLKPKKGGRVEGFPVSKDAAEREVWARQQAQAIELERLALASGANRGEGSVDALHAALVDLRALVGIGGVQGPYFRGAREAVEATLAAVDQLLAGTATYPALPAAVVEPAQRLHA